MSGDKQLSEKFKPRFFIHSREKYLPCEFSTYLSGCSLWHRDQLILDEGRLTLFNISRKSLFGSMVDETKWRLKSSRKNYTHSPMELKNVCIYSTVNHFEDNIAEVVYFYFFPYNSGYKVFGKTFGAHYADIEHCTVRVERNIYTDEWERVGTYYAAHGSKWGQWDYSGRSPTVYIANGSHASYPSAGTYGRIYGFANDHCDDGYEWCPKIEYVDDTHVLRRYYGTWGPDGVSNIARQPWFTHGESSYNSNVVERLLLPCLLT